jgi:hypothetical protein
MKRTKNFPSAQVFENSPDKPNMHIRSRDVAGERSARTARAVKQATNNCEILRRTGVGALARGIRA